MKRSWITITVFVSSTFSDMQSERDYLKKIIIPRLEDELAPFQIRLELIDLRWGVNATETLEVEKESKVLKVCLDLIKNNRPFFIALLGDRYGWIPTKEHWDRIYNNLDHADQLLVSNTEGKSVTNLEILFGAIGDKELLKRSLFYFRDEKSYENMPEEQAGIYRIKYSNLSETEKLYHHECLETLKQDIISVCDNSGYSQNCKTYHLDWSPQEECFANFESWGDQIYQHLLNEIKEELALTQDQIPTHWYEKEKAAFEAFVFNRTELFCGKDELLDELETLLLQKQTVEQIVLNKNSCFLIGDSGSGKSAVFCKIFERLSAKKESGERIIILAHSAGVTDDSRDAVMMIKRWCWELSKEIGSNFDIDGQYPSDELTNIFKSFAMIAYLKNFRIILLVDSYDSFYQDKLIEDLNFILPITPLLCTAIGGFENRALRSHKNFQIKKMEDFSEKNASDFFISLCNKRGKSVSEKVLEYLLSISFDNTKKAYSSPLWLTLATDILSTLDIDDFEKIKKRPEKNEDMKIEAYLLELISTYPPDSSHLFRLLLDRAGEDFGHDLTWKALSYIAISRNGLTDGDLAALLKAHWNLTNFTMLRRWFRRLIIEQGSERRWVFTHAKLKETLLKDLDQAQLEKYHQDIIEHFLSLSLKDHVSDSEMLYHLIRANDVKSFCKCYVEDKQTQDNRIYSKIIAEILKDNNDETINFVKSIVRYDTPQKSKLYNICKNIISDLINENLHDRFSRERQSALRIGEFMKTYFKENLSYDDFASIADFISSNNSIARVLTDVQEIDKAIEYYYENIEVTQKSNFYFWEVQFIYGNLMHLYESKGNPEIIDSLLKEWLEYYLHFLSFGEEYEVEMVISDMKIYIKDFDHYCEVGTKSAEVRQLKAKAEEIRAKALEN